LQTNQAIEDQDTWWTSYPEEQEKEYREMQAKTRKYAERAHEVLRKNLLYLPQDYASSQWSLSSNSNIDPYSKCLWINDEYDGIIKSNVIQLCGDTPFPISAEDATRDLLMLATTTP
jgi:hypothetical protein